MRLPQLLGRYYESSLSIVVISELLIDSEGGKMFAFLAGIGLLAKQVFEWVAAGAIIGGLLGGGVNGAIEVVTGVHEQGEFNREVADDALHGALDGAKNGALFGAAAGVVGGAVSTAVNLGRGVHLAHSFRSLPKTTAPAGYLYVVDDALYGTSKIGITNNPTRRLSELQTLLGRNLNFAGIKRANNARAVESALHTRYAGQNVASAYGREWFHLSSFDKAVILGW